MARVRVLILHATGTNRDRETARAWEVAGGEPEIVHINQVLRGERRLADYHMLVLPGGFSYGDALGAGRLWAVDLRYRLGEAIQAFIASGRPVLGICNGFQALVKAGWLPGPPFTGEGGDPQAVTLTYNASGRFECRWVWLAANPSSPCVFTRGLTERILCPVAHGEGRFVPRDAVTLQELQSRGLIALTYVAPDGGPAQYPWNPNGSVADIAGICNVQGNVLGLMPHPEDHIFPWQHPRWTRGESGGLGLALFTAGIRYAASL
jgi:phosphoribosylformylglycinamidine synthase